MRCKICGCEDAAVTYEGKIRDGRVGNYTSEKMKLFRCGRCGTIWHDNSGRDSREYYQSEAYRNELEGTSDVDAFYRLHDGESLEKFRYTGTEIFRGKTVADIGCGAGAFLDYIQAVAARVIAIEPSETYRESMRKRGYTVFGYAQEALEEYRGKVDVIVSFDVIEHVEDPQTFLEEAYALLSNGGKAFIGTPTDAPVMREVLGGAYESFLFSTQHPWVLSEGSFAAMAERCGITGFGVRYYQRYGLGNFVYWLLNRQPGRHKGYDFITKTMDRAWISELEQQKKSDYIVCEIVKDVCACEGSGEKDR